MGWYCQASQVYILFSDIIGCWVTSELAVIFSGFWQNSLIPAALRVGCLSNSYKQRIGMLRR